MKGHSSEHMTTCLHPHNSGPDIDFEFSFDDLFVCGDCKRAVTDVFRPEPLHIKTALERMVVVSKAEVPMCNVCMEKIAKSDDESKNCIAHCIECDDLTFHKTCLPYHEINCSNTSRAERALRMAEQTIAATESELRKAKSFCARIQHDITSLERKLAQAEQKKEQAERDLL